MSYSEKVLDHYENPRNVGSFEKDQEDVGTGMVGAPACFVGSTLIAVPSTSGVVSLEELYNKGEIVWVWSLNLKTSQLELKKASCIKTGTKAVVQLTLDDNAVITCTPDHKFLLASGEYAECGVSSNVSLKSFNKIVDNNGYWQINRQAREHVAFIKATHNVPDSLMWVYNVDHKNENKRDNCINNLELLTISGHNAKSRTTRNPITIAEQVQLLSQTILFEDVHRMTVIEQLPRWQIGDELNIHVEWVKELQRFYGLTASPRRLLPEEQIIAASRRKMREGNPNFSGVSDQELLQVGNTLYVKHGKLTNKIWKDNASYYGVPSKVEHRFSKFSNFVDQAVSFNHKIVDVRPQPIPEDVYCLQVEENNNFVVLTSLTLNRQSGIVVKNCGDVMKLQIKVNSDGVIEDAKFKTYGCGSAIASSSLVTEWLKGKTLDQAVEISNVAIAEELALPPVKIHCSILAEDAIKAAVADYKQKHPEDLES